MNFGQTFSFSKVVSCSRSTQSLSRECHAARSLHIGGLIAITELALKYGFQFIFQSKEL